MNIENRPRRTKIISEALMFLGIPEMYAIGDFTICDFKGEELVSVKEIVQNYLDNLTENASNGNGLYLFGSTGTGKTSLASLVLIEAYWQRYTIQRVTLYEYLRDHMALWKASPEQKEELEDQFHRKYKSAEFLCLEEIGKENETKFNTSILEDLIRYRCERRLPTIYCVNFDIETLAERYSESISSLISESCTPIKLKTNDRRVQR